MNRRVAIAGALLFAVLLVSALAGRSLRESATGRRPSSYAPGPEGMLAFRRLLVESGHAPSTSTEPWNTRLASVGIPSLLIVSTPCERPPSSEEIEALRDALEGGLRVLVLDDASELEAPLALDEWLESIGLGAQRAVSDYDPEMLTVRRPPTRRGLGTPARPSDPGFERLVLDRARIHANTDAVPLAIDDDGAVLAAVAAVGEGRVVRVMGVPAANDRLLEGHNLEFVLQLVHHLSDGGEVIFDEFRHGYGSALPLRGSNASVWALFGTQAIVATLLYGAARGIRFGPPRPDPPPMRRSSNEFVRSMASLYLRAGAHRHAVEEARQRFVREARARWTVPEGLSVDRLATLVSQHTGLDFERVRETLYGAEVALATPWLESREMVERVRELARLEEESFGGRATGA